jgi:predicted permease
MDWVFRLFSRRRRYDDLSVSIQEHIAERVDELIAEGMPRDEAEQTARREFGNVGLMEQRSREAWQWPAIESLLGDLKLIFRRLRKSPGFTATVLLTLAIGIGANTAVFSVVNSVILRPLAYPDSDRVLALSLDAPGAEGLTDPNRGLGLSASMYLTFARLNRSFESMGVWIGRFATVTGVAEPEEVNAEYLSDGVLETLAVPPAAGRWLSAADQDPHGAMTVMLSYGYWQRRFGGDRAAIGRSIQVDGDTRTIVGVMPRGFRLADEDFELLIPIAYDPANQKLAGFSMTGIARLKPGVSIAQANADIRNLIPVWMDSWSNGPGTNPHYYERWKINPNFRPLKQMVIGEVGKVLWVVMATVGVVMLIACVNVANLLMVRAEARHQELSIRAALGAGRGRIARELLVESLMLGLIGGLLGVGVAYEGLRLLLAIEPADLPRLSEIGLDGWSLGFTLAVSVLSGLLFGSIPVLRYARTKATALMGGASRTASTGRMRQRSRDGLVVAQVAMALVLLVSALLMIRTFVALRHVQPGFTDAAHVETISTWIPEQEVPNMLNVAHMENDIADRLAGVPGVISTGFAVTVPMDGHDANADLISVEGKHYEGGEPPLRLYNYVAPGYFRSLGTQIVAGRDYTWDDVYGLRNRIIVSENFARESWGSAGAAIGKRVRQFSNTPWQEVIGVVEDVHVHGVNDKAPAIIYWPAMLNNPYTPQPTIFTRRFITFTIHSSRAGSGDFLKELEQAVWSVNPNLPLARVSTMQEIYSQSMARTSFTLVMLAIAGSMALILGVLGIYGVISYTVSQRTREIGIRLALGAQKSDLKWMFVRSALVLTGIGVVVGSCGAAALTQSMKALLFGISPLDPLTYTAIPLVLIVAAVMASYLPARRAASIDPVEALRAE